MIGLGVSLRFNTAYITGPGVTGAIGHSCRRKPPSQRSRDTWGRNNVINTILSFQNDSNFQILSTDAECRSVILGGDLNVCDITLTKIITVH